MQGLRQHHHELLAQVSTLLPALMNIVNQINAGLNDVRSTLVAMSQGDASASRSKARYQLDLIMDMVDDRDGQENGREKPWSELKHQVDEEFSD